MARLSLGPCPRCGYWPTLFFTDVEPFIELCQSCHMSAKKRFIAQLRFHRLVISFLHREFVARSRLDWQDLSRRWAGLVLSLRLRRAAWRLSLLHGENIGETSLEHSRHHWSTLTTRVHGLYRHARHAPAWVPRELPEWPLLHEYSRSSSSSA